MFEKFKKILYEKGEVYLRVKVRPGSALSLVREIMDSEEGETVKVDIAAPPEKGRANVELIRYLAQEFDVKRESVIILSGKAEKLKLVKIINK